MGYQEEKSSALLQETLRNEGFTIRKGVADIPTAFIAEYKNGGPVIALLGEFDALPGLSQKAVAYKIKMVNAQVTPVGITFGTALQRRLCLKSCIQKIKLKALFVFTVAPLKKAAQEEST